MAAATITAPDTEDGSFFVTDEMYLEIQAYVNVKVTTATQAVICPVGAARGGWDFELAHSDSEARAIAREIGPDAVVLDL